MCYFIVLYNKKFYVITYISMLDNIKNMLEHKIL